MTRTSFQIPRPITSCTTCSNPMRSILLFTGLSEYCPACEESGIEPASPQVEESSSLNDAQGLIAAVKRLGIHSGCKTFVAWNHIPGALALQIAKKELGAITVYCESSDCSPSFSNVVVFQF